LLSHPDQPHCSKYFKYDKYERVLTRVGDKKEWINFIVESFVNNNDIYYMSFEILKTAHGRISLGMGGKSIFGKFDTLTAM